MNDSAVYSRIVTDVTFWKVGRCTAGFLSWDITLCSSESTIMGEEKAGWFEDGGWVIVKGRGKLCPNGDVLWKPLM